jgi:hypothetical protein
MRGGSRSSRTLRWDAMDERYRSIRSRMRTNEVSRTAKPCGPDAPTLALSWSMILAYHADDGGNKARSPGRARSKPLKPLRGEGRMNPLSPVATTLVCFLFCTRGCGCSEHPVFPAPSLEGRLRPLSSRDKIHATARAQSARRECWRLSCADSVIACNKCEALVRGSASDAAIQLCFYRAALDRFAEPVIGRAFARPVGSQ